ncbi:MAG: hypothetical protein ABIH83_00400 [Candidatus Micrarchaeota archaeon]
MEKLVNNYIKKGRAASKAEVVRMGLNKLREEEKQEAEKEEKDISKFIMANANRDYWEDPEEDKVWNKYLE